MNRITSTSLTALAAILAAPILVGSGNTAKDMTFMLAAAQTAPVEAPLTNSDVIKLCKLDLGNEVVIAKINQAKAVDFKLDTDSLISLKQGGVGKEVIAAMLQRTTSAPPASVSVPSTLEVWTIENGNSVEIPSVSGYVEASIGQAFKQAFLFSFKNKMAVLVHGTNAKTHFTAAPPIIYTRYKPSEIGVARLTVQSDKERRYIWVVSRVGSNSGEFYPPEDDMKFTDERTPEGTYKLTFKAQLTPGEYALIAPEGKTGYVFHDFVIDGSAPSLERVVPFQPGVSVPLGIVQGVVTINSVEVIAWPKPAGLQKAEGRPEEMTSLTLKFAYSNQGKQEWKCKYSLVVLDDKGAEIGSGEREASLGGSEKTDTNRVSVKMKTLDFPKAVNLRVRVVLARAD